MIETEVIFHVIYKLGINVTKYLPIMLIELNWLSKDIEKCQLLANLYKNFDLSNLIIRRSLYNIESIFCIYIYILYLCVYVKLRIIYSYINKKILINQ